MEKTVTRRLTPAGLLLAALLFLVLPLTTASCDSPDMKGTAAGRIGTSVTGLDVVRSAEHLDATGGLAVASPAQQARLDGYLQMPTGARVLVALTVLVMLGTLVAAAVPLVRARAATGAAGALAALALATVAERHVSDRVTEVADLILTVSAYLPAVEGRQDELRGRLDEVVHVGWGYWLSASVLVLLIAANVAAYIRAARRPPPVNIG